MNPWFPRLLYFVPTAWPGLAANLLTRTAAVGTIGASLAPVRAFALTVRNMEELLDRFVDALRLTAYLEDDLDASASRRSGSAVHPA